MATEPRHDTNGQPIAWASVIASITVGALVGAVIGMVLGYALGDFTYASIAIAVGAALGMGFYLARRG